MDDRQRLAGGVLSFGREGEPTGSQGPENELNNYVWFQLS